MAAAAAVVVVFFVNVKLLKHAMNIQKRRKYSETEMIVVNASTGDWKWEQWTSQIKKTKRKKKFMYERENDMDCSMLWLPLWQYPFCSQSTVPYDIELGTLFYSRVFFFASHLLVFRCVGWWRREVGCCFFFLLHFKCDGAAPPPSSLLLWERMFSLTLAMDMIFRVESSFW